MPKLKLTQHSIRTQCRAPGPDDVTVSGKPVLQHVYFDSELTSFCLVVRRPKGAEINATFMVIKSVGGRIVKRKVVRYGEATVEQARKQARAIVVALDNGEGLESTPEPAITTLADAVRTHVEGMLKRGCSPISIETLRDEAERHLASWLTLPLTKISRAMCAERHSTITTKSGPHVANRVFRHLRAVYMTAARMYETLSSIPPTVAIAWNEQLPSEARVLWPDLPVWWATAQGMSNGVRRDLQTFLLFTGLRSTDARTVRWDEIDFEKRTIYRPKPKGGRKRAFRVPLSSFVVELLKRRRDENPALFPQGDHGWVFPTKLASGEIGATSVAREMRYVPGSKSTKKVALLPSPHALRRTFICAAHEAGVNPYDLKTLVNHAQPKGDITHSYIQVSVEHLRGAIESVTAFLLEKAGQPATKPETQPKAM